MRRSIIRGSFDSRVVLLVTWVAAVLVSGCGRLFQNDINPDSASLFGPGEGVILGSVTAPFIERYHETLRFHYRSLGDRGRTTGHLTSAAKFWTPGIPTCDKDGLTEQCGRLFAVSLPAGDYEIFGVQEVDPGSRIHVMPPLRFTVVQGRRSYLGNVHTAFCQGLVRSTRGGILGGDLTIRDESQRDLALLTARYPQLTGADIEMQLLPDLGWRWRVPWEPYDWGSCGE